MNQLIDNRYKIISRLGRGGMADVYLAEDSVLRREVAIKVLDDRFTDGAEFVERFQREARAAASLSHPNIVSVHDQGQTNGSHYIVMEYLRGKTLSDILEHEGSLAPAKATDITLMVLNGLAYAHEHGVIHRDIKPQNIVLDERGQVKVTDFGIARTSELAPRVTTAGSILGTAHYLSPEQARGTDVCPGSDLYAVGIVLFEMICGRVPFEGDNLMAVIFKHLNDGPPAPQDINPRIPANLSTTVSNSLQKDPQVRYVSAQEFISDLIRCRKGEPVASRQPTSPPNINSTIIVSQLSCSTCGQVCAVGMKFCTTCGTPLHLETQLTDSGSNGEDTALQDSLSGRCCPSCGEKAKNNAKFCTICGYSLTEGIDSLKPSSPESSAQSLNALLSLNAGAQTPPAATPSINPSIDVSMMETAMTNASVETNWIGGMSYGSMFRMDLTHSGCSPEPGVHQLNELKWKFLTQGKVVSSPVLSNGLIYIGSFDKSLYALDILSGQSRWSFHCGKIESTPAVANNVIYFGNDDTHLYALDASDGKELWRFKTKSSIRSSPLVIDGVVYFSSRDGFAYAVDTKTGQEKWRLKLGRMVISSSAYSQGMLFIGSFDKNLYAIDVKTGQAKWIFPTMGAIRSSPSVLGDIVFCGSKDCTLYAINIKTGQHLWGYHAEGKIDSSPAIFSGTVFVGSSDGKLYAIDIKTGQLKWAFLTAGKIESSPTVSEGIIYFGSGDGNLYSVDISGEALWTFKTGGNVNSSPAVANNMVYFGSDDGSLYAVG